MLEAIFGKPRTEKKHSLDTARTMIGDCQDVVWRKLGQQKAQVCICVHNRLLHEVHRWHAMVGMIQEHEVEDEHLNLVRF